MDSKKLSMFQNENTSTPVIPIKLKYQARQAF